MRLASLVKVSTLSEAAVSVDDQERARHGTGHCLSDILDLRTSSLRRSPDAVVYPTCQDDVVAIVKLAEAEELCLIPFGGGTNVSSALTCPDFKVRENEERRCCHLCRCF